MSQKARVSVLTRELLTEFRITEQVDKSKQLNSLEDRILHTLLDPKPARTNQFDVAARVEGLEEKFRIFHNDELADALRERVDELSTRSDRWTPEILALLLNLSDQPLQETRIEGLDGLKPEPRTPALTWSDIVADDPLDNHDGLWDDVDFARDGSDEDADSIIGVSSPSSASSTTSNEPNGIATDIEGLVLPPDDNGLEDIIKSQFWTQKVQGALEIRDSRSVSTEALTILTEAQMIREVGSMLHGLPATIFEQRTDDGLVLVSRYRLKHVPQGQASELLRKLGVIGAELARLRHWKSQEQLYPLLQALQAVVGERLAAVEHDLTQIQAKCLQSQGGYTISLLCFYDTVQSETQLFRRLGPLLEELEHNEESPRPFHILEMLYDRVCLSHSIGDADAFEYVAEVFFACLQTYLKPLKHWMEFGELSRLDQDIFVRDGELDASLDEIWARRHLLRFDDTGHLHAPRFLHLAGKRILNTGKSVNFLRLLGYSWPDNDAKEQGDSQLDLKRICTETNTQTLSSFSEAFDRALNGWIASSYHSSSALLRHQLEMQCGLSRVLNALDHVYLFRNGALTSAITSAISARIDRSKQDWNDDFVLTELFRSAFATTCCVDTESLTVRTSRVSMKGSIGRQRSMESLTTLRVMYSLPWPIANIINKNSMETYQGVLILLLQLQRAKQTLERRIPRNLVIALMKDRVGSYAVMLRHRMLWFVNTVFSHLVDVVLSTATAEMRLKMARSGDIDELITIHQIYIARLNEQCLFSKERRPVLQAITSILDLVILLVKACASYGSKPARLRQRLDNGEHFSSDHNESDDETELDPCDVGLKSPTEGPSAARLNNMRDTFQQLYGFILVSLRGASKHGENGGLEMLTEMLALGYRRGGHTYG